MITKKDYVYGELKKLISKGDFKEGELLISENEICKRYNVSREPVRRALKKLKENGYVNSKQGKGYYINPREFYLNTTITSLSVESNKIISTSVLDFKVIKNDIKEFSGSEYLYSYSRVIETNDNVIYEKGYIPKDLFESFSIEKCKGSILSYFEDEMKLTLTHDRKELKSIMVESDHIINQYIPEKITNSIQTTHQVYSNNSLIQISRQIKYNSNIIIVSMN